MKELLKLLTKEEQTTLNKIVKNYNDMSDVESQLADYMMQNCIENDKITKEGIIIEKIIDKLVELN